MRPGLHVGLDDARGRHDRLVDVRAVGPDDERGVRHVEEVEAAPDAEDPLVVLDVEGALRAAHLADVPQVADDERQQVAHDVRRHVAERGAQRVGEQVLLARLAAVAGLDRGEVDRGAALAVQRQGVLVRFDPDHERVDGLVVGAEDALELPAEGERRRSGRPRGRSRSPSSRGCGPRASGGR